MDRLRSFCFFTGIGIAVTLVDAGTFYLLTDRFGWEKYLAALAILSLSGAIVGMIRGVLDRDGASGLVAGLLAVIAPAWLAWMLLAPKTDALREPPIGEREAIIASFAFYRFAFYALAVLSSTPWSIALLFSLGTLVAFVLIASFILKVAAQETAKR
ncbi:MAG: hypothetical protein WDN10_01730 [bacterium]